MTNQVRSRLQTLSKTIVSLHLQVYPFLLEKCCYWPHCNYWQDLFPLKNFKCRSRYRIVAIRITVHVQMKILKGEFNKMRAYVDTRGAPADGGLVAMDSPGNRKGPNEPTSVVRGP